MTDLRCCLFLRSGLLVAGLALTMLVTGCSDDQQELRAWMQEQRARTPIKIDPVPAPKHYEPFRYQSAALADPFGSPQLVARASSGLTPDMKRPREALESFPLDTIRMIGRINDGRRNLALLQVGGLVYQAKVGNHAGQNFGRITSVTESEVKLIEMVQDAAGDWTERETVLQLQTTSPQETKK